MSVFPYRDVDSSGGEIRLLCIQPAKFDSPIECRLKHVRLSENPEYEALSYTWGNLKEGRPITLDGNLFRVRENAESALRYLRNIKKERVIWVDAICINQTSLPGRNKQVLLMKDIYGKAQKVCVWLGELTEGASLGINFLLNRNLSLGWQQRKIDREHGRIMHPWKPFGGAVATMTRVELLREQTAGEIRELLDRPWWKRVWIVQEVVLARKIVLMCGPETIPWEKIEDGVARFQTRSTYAHGRNHALLQGEGVLANPTTYFPDDIYRTIKALRTRLAASPNALDVFEVLNRLRLLHCSKPYDRIYGFLGIVPPHVASNIKPDYSSPMSIADLRDKSSRRRTR